MFLVDLAIVVIVRHDVDRPADGCPGDIDRRAHHTRGHVDRRARDAGRQVHHGAATEQQQTRNHQNVRCSELTFHGLVSLREYSSNCRDCHTGSGGPGSQITRNIPVQSCRIPGIKYLHLLRFPFSPGLTAGQHLARDSFKGLDKQLVTQRPAGAGTRGNLYPKIPDSPTARIKRLPQGADRFW